MYFLGIKFINILQPKEKQIQNKATINQGEPNAFSFASFSPSGITSDQYSFLDMQADDLLSKRVREDYVKCIIM